MSKAIFLDRDGTINVDKSYIYRVEDLQFEEKVIDALRLSRSSDYKLIIVTGQSGIGRGKYTEKDYHNFMRAMYALLQQQGINLDGEYFCPHHPTEGIGRYKKDCECRKPKIGMLKQAVKDHNINLSQSWVIGDKTDDIEMGRRASCKTILVKTGKAGKDNHFKVNPGYTANNLLEAIEYILSQ